MTLKMTFLGTGSAFTVGTGNYQSNLLLEYQGDTLLIDAGTDVRHSLFEKNRNYLDIHSAFISHLHNDHCGGLEWLALNTYFDPRYQGKPKLYVSHRLVDSLWDHSLRAALSTLEEKQAGLDTYFDIHVIDSPEQFTWNGVTFNLVPTTHYCNNHQLMPSYGLFFSANNQRVFYTGDTQYTPQQLHEHFEKADIIFHDCETLPFKSGVHAHYSDLVNLPAEIKAKMWLYHYNPVPLPDAKKDGFLGFVVKGQVFEF